MSSQHTTMETTYTTASRTKAATDATNETTRQTSIDAQKSSVGFIPGFTNSATLVTTTAAANATLAQNRYIAEMTKQTTQNVARDTMRNANTGEVQ